MPTYNFGAFIGETLESILPQLEPGVEIVVLDGGSTDDTPQVMERFRRRSPAIRYVRQPARGGIDRDMARCVDLAQGEYCWLFSSDDLMRPGALKRVLSEIGSGLDLYVCGLTLCDKGMKVIGEHPVSRAQRGSVFQLREAAERERYFALADTTTALFSFMGSLIFRRRRFLEQPLEEAYVGSCWAHVVRILRMIPHGLELKYLGESLQWRRGGNDSFMDKGMVHRYAIAIDGYHRIAADVFGDASVEAYHMRRVVADEFSLRVMLVSRLHCQKHGQAAELPGLERLALKAWRDRSWLNRARSGLYQSQLANGAFRGALAVYRTLRRLRPRRRAA